MGDFNVPYIDWINVTTLPRARIIEKDVFEAISDNFLYQKNLYLTSFLLRRRGM